MRGKFFKAVILVLFVGAAIASFRTFSLRQPRKKKVEIKNVANFVEARNDYFKSKLESPEERVLRMKNWSAIGIYFGDSSSEHNRFKLFKAMQSLLDRKKVFKSDNDRKKVRSIVYSYLNSERTKSKTNKEIKALNLAVGVASKLGYPKSIDEIELLEKWLSDDVLFRWRTGFSVLAQMRPVSRQWMKRIRELLPDVESEKFRFLVECILNMKDFGAQKTLFHFLEDRLHNLSEANKPFIVKVLFMHIESLKNAQALSDYAYKKTGRVWDDVVVTIVERSKYDFISRSKFEARVANMKGTFVLKRAKKILSLVASKEGAGAL